MHNIKKILLPFLLFFALNNYINAAIQNGDVITIDSEDWTVTNATDNEECKLEARSEPKVQKAKSTYTKTFGYTYENTCTNVETQTMYFCSMALRNPVGKCDGGAEGNHHEVNTTGPYMWGYSIEEDKNNFVAILNEASPNVKNYTNEKNVGNSILKISSEDSEEVGGESESSVVTEGGKLEYPTTNDGDNPDSPDAPDGIKSTAKVGCTWFIDYITDVYVAAMGTCSQDYDCSYEVCPEEGEEGDCTIVPQTCTRTTPATTVYTMHAHEFDDCVETSINDYLDPSINKPPTCPSGYDLTSEIYGVASFGDVYRRSTGSASKIVCTNVEPAKVEVYTNKLTIHGRGLDKEAYCINPSYDFNSSYTWDTTFDASKCHDSLHSYNPSTNELEFDMECGYVYIIAEAKRINAEVGKEVFDFSTISTAMRLFGTGITTKDESLPVISDMTEHLAASGYYSTYYGWGYGEFVGIPGIRPPKPSSWPAIYQYFMPKFYSIYIHTAEAAETYLKNNIRFSDVGNKECTDNSNGYCVEGVDDKKYIVDANYYLNHKECKTTFENCTSSATDLYYNDSDLTDRIESFPEVQGSGIQNYLVGGTGQIGTCTNESGLGVMCGLENEAVSNGHIGDSDYIDAIYLYIRALQGNKIVYEDKVQNAVNRYAPVEGLSKVIYNANGDEEGYILRYTIDPQTVYDKSTVECTAEDDMCEAYIYLFDQHGNLLQKNDHYDYCEKNYCYVKIEKQKVCISDGTSDKITSVVVTDPNLKSNIIKKIGNGGRKEQILYVYDDTNSISGGFCEDIVAVKDNIPVKCTCDAKEHPNNLPPDSNIDGDKSCKENYNDYDELYYGDPSMSSIIYACSDEDSNKFNFTDDLNANGNDLVHEGEQPVSKYSYQIKSDNFNVCTLYCRDESRLYLANKITVRAGMHLKYDIGGKLLNKKIINETVNQRDSQSYKYMPGVVLQYRECTSVFDYEKWKKLYDSADNQREKNQLIYSAYNCNLYTTDEIVNAINKGDIPDILGLKNGKYINKTGKEFADKNSLNNNYAEPAMIKYSYNMDDGKTTIVNDWGTTKDYLLIQEACTSIGKSNGAECANYNITSYSDTYIKQPPNGLGINMNYEHGLVDSNLNITIHCTGESCYKLKDSEGNYYYNPYAENKNDYTVIDERTVGNKLYHESGKILRYSEWALLPDQSDEYKSKYASKRETHSGYKIPKNEFSSFMVVTETGFYNDKKYYANRYDGEIYIEAKDDTIELDPNIYPLHLNKKEGRYKITHKISRLRTAYQRSTYFIEKNYALEENISYNTDKLPSTFQYVCYYDVHNITTPPQGGEFGFTYRIVDLEDVFASIPKDGESINGDTRDYPENWSNKFAKETLDQIENSSSNILMPENLANNESYLEYSYTLTKQGIIKIRNYNDSQKDKGGYLNNTLRNCEYDPEEEIFYNCDSSFLDEISQPNSEYFGNDLITINKDNGASEFCSSNVNSDKSYCKYQKKESLTAGGNN